MTDFNIKNFTLQTKEAAPVLASIDSSLKDKILREMAKELRNQKDQILSENQKDLKVAEEMGLSAAMKDRLLLNEDRIHGMASGLEEVAELKDPVGQIIKEWTRPNGLLIKRVRIPLGVIGVVYESRPNVTVDAAGLCFKSGNAVILRGGKEAFHSNQILGSILQSVLEKNHLPKALIQVVPTTDRDILKEMLSLVGLIDLMIPRGGDRLMQFMNENSKIPVVKHDKGVCNLYVDESADKKMAINIAHNSKVHRPGVCNALENLFIHKAAAEKILPDLAEELMKAGVEIRGDDQVLKFIPSAQKATDEDWEEEYLDLILSIRIVDNIEEAIELIRRYGSLHTESIVTQDKSKADQFVRSLDSSCVLVNASTRFNDGGQLGLGAEIGISTTKLHAFGPMGLEELTTSKFVVEGEGQVRE